MCNFSNMGYIYDTSGLSLLSPFSKTPGGTYSCRALGSHKPHHGRYHLLEKETVAVAVFESVCLSDLVVFYPYPQILPPLMSFFLFRPSPQVMLAVKNLPANAIDVRNTVQFLRPADPLEEGLATRSNILFWRITWREEPGRLLSIGSQSQTLLK